MLKIYDQNKNPLGYIIKYSDDLCVESDLSNGDKSLSFTYLAKKPKDIRNEYYVETQTDRYVVKEVGSSSDGFPEYKCQLDLEDLEADMFESFSALNVKLEDAAKLALAGTGWTVRTDITKIRSVATLKATPLTILGKIRDAWMCEIRYDNKNKVVYFRETLGDDKGVFFTRGLNLRKISLTSDSYDYYTRIIPIGKDDLRITDVNGGKNYVENYQYSSKVRTLIWEDTSYEDAQSLKEDAEKKLDDLSKPKKSYSAEIIDLAKQNPDYSIMSFALGDTILLLDEQTGIKDKQRIVKLTEYPRKPEKNTCELSNTTLTFDELQTKLQAAADALENITNKDGTVNGVYVHGISKDGVVEIETIINGSDAVNNLISQMSDAQTGLSYVNGQLSVVSEKVGTLEATTLKATEAHLKYATIERADIIEANVHSIEGDYASFKTTVTDEFAAHTAMIDQVSGDLASFKTGEFEELRASTLKAADAELQYAKIDLANIAQGSITTAMLGTAVVGTTQIADGSITDAKIVELTANKINAGTLSVERLEIRGSSNSIVYALNDITGALQSQNVDTLNGEILTPRSITADRIVANAITANEIAAKTITANEINVTDLFAQDITATGTIRGVKLEGATGSFTGSVTADTLIANTGGSIGGFKISSTGISSDVVSIYSYYSGKGAIFLTNNNSNYRLACYDNGLFVRDTSTSVETEQVELGFLDGTAYPYFRLKTSGVDASENFVNIKSNGYALFRASTDSYVTINNGTVDAKGNIKGKTIYENGTALSSKYASKTESLRIFTRSEVSTSLNIDDPGINGVFEHRPASETPNWSGTRPPLNGYYPFLNFKTGDNIAMLQIAGSGTSYYIRGGQSSNVTMSGVSWRKILTADTTGYINHHMYLRTTDSNYLGYHVRNSLRNISFMIGTSGAGGIYDNDRSRYIIKNDTNGDVVINEKAAVPLTDNSAIRPLGDNAYWCGHPSYRFQYLYAVSGTIQTSDEREKDILSGLSPADLSDYFMSLKPIAYRWNSGNDRRIHFGLGAQTAKASLEQAGYNPEDFSLIQHDILDEVSATGLTDRYGMDYQGYNILTMAQTQKNTRDIMAINDWQKGVDVELACVSAKQESLEYRIASLQEQLADANARIAEQAAEIEALKTAS